MHKIITYFSEYQMALTQVVQHLRQWHLPVLPEAVEITALQLGPILPKATLPKK